MINITYILYTYTSYIVYIYIYILSISSILLLWCCVCHPLKSNSGIQGDGFNHFQCDDFPAHAWNTWTWQVSFSSSLKPWFHCEMWVNFFTFMASRLKIVQWCLASGESKAGQDLQVPIRTLFRTLQTKATLFGLAMMQSSAMQLCHLCQVVPPVVNYRTHLGASPVQITTPRSSIFRNAGHPSKHANGIKSFFG